MDMRFGTWNVRITETLLVARTLMRHKLDFMIVKERRCHQESFHGRKASFPRGEGARKRA
jgi:hypothetical protein